VQNTCADVLKLFPTAELKDFNLLFGAFLALVFACAGMVLEIPEHHLLSTNLSSFLGVYNAVKPKQSALSGQCIGF
jgi:hypothetical protein